MDFNALHHQPQTSLIANVWDASSALVAEQAGYSDTTDGIANHIHRLAVLGVVRINLEDSHVVNGVSPLDDAAEFFCRLQLLSQACPGIFRTCAPMRFCLTPKMR